VPEGSDGEHRAVLETGIQRFGGSWVGGGLGQPAAGEESARAQDGHEGLLVGGASAATRDDTTQLHSLARDSGIAGSDATAQATDSHGAMERNRVQKVLEEANIKIGSVLSDVFGASGQDMLLALVEGKATPKEIAQLAKRQARKKIPQLQAAIEGHRMTETQRQLIRQCMSHLAFWNSRSKRWINRFKRGFVLSSSVNRMSYCKR
jgi:hypothetical protein